MNVTIISCVYGDSHDRFVADWMAGIRRLNPQPHQVIVATDHPRKIRGAMVVRASGGWNHPQACHLERALRNVETEWVWIHDIDDYAFEDALVGLDGIHADVWQMGYERSDGVFYLPPNLSAEQVLESAANPFVAGSCIRTDALRSVGGFPDLALQDWALWRALARAEATFVASDRTHFYYRRHEQARGVRELTAAHRSIDMAEMLAYEESHAVAA